MGKSKSILTLILLLVFVCANAAFGMVYPSGNEPQPIEIKGKVVVQFEDNVELFTRNKMATSSGVVNFNLPTFDAVMEKHQVYEAKAVFPWRKSKPAVNSGLKDLTRYYVIEFPEDVEVSEIVAELLQNKNVRYAEPVMAIPVDATPNDPMWPNQWWAHTSGTPNPNFFNAWDYETGSDSIKFALIDSGILYNHEDLQGNIWVNPGEDLDGDGDVYDADDINGIDDDGNGLIDDVIGWDFFSGFSGVVLHPSEDPAPPDNNPSDFNGHGTHVAGIAAAMNNNSVGVTGSAGGWYGGAHAATNRGVRIICCRVGGSASDDGGASYSGYVNTLNCAQAIDYSAMMGANVMNGSWGGSSTSAAAVANAIVQGITFTHAAGNGGANDPDDIDGVSNVVSVASVAQPNDMKSSFSNFGNWVDVSAPGSSIRSTYSFSGSPGYASIGGTSMAAPMAAGVVLLIRSMMPSLTGYQADSIMMATADSLPLYSTNILYVSGQQLGSGRINAEAALASLANAKFTADVTQGHAPLTVNFSDLSPNSPVAWKWHFGNGDSSDVQNPAYVYNEPGIYSVSLLEDENHPLGFGEEHLKDYIWVTDDTITFGSVDSPNQGIAKVPVTLYNSHLVKEIQFAFSYANNFGIKFDSFNVDGTRTSYFESVGINAIDPGGQKASILLKSNIGTGSTYLPSDTGLVVNLFFTVNATTYDTLTIDTISFNGKSPFVKTIYGDYWPANFTPGKINITGCCIGETGDINNDGGAAADISDLLFLVDFMFLPPGTAPAPDCMEEADVNGDKLAAPDIADLLYLVDFMFLPPGTAPNPASCF